MKVDWTEELARVGIISKAELARLLGVSRSTVTRWGDKLPPYVVAYLDERSKRLGAEWSITQLTKLVKELRGV